MVETLYTAYKASDGMLFEDRKAAQEHEVNVAAYELLNMLNQSQNGARKSLDARIAKDYHKILDHLETLRRYVQNHDIPF